MKGINPPQSIAERIKRIKSGNAHEQVRRITNPWPDVDGGNGGGCDHDHQLHHRPKSGLSKKGKVLFQSEEHVHLRCYLRAKHTTCAE